MIVKTKNEIEREARPGNVGEVTIREKDNIVLYPLVPIPVNTHFVATIIYDLVRANVRKEQIKDYKEQFFGKISLSRILKYVEQRGRLVYTRFEKGKGWTDLEVVNINEPLKKITK